jgi:D-arginine dehydrogenase
MSGPNTADVVVIGGGIAGVSAAYQLASTHRVVLLEREPQLAHHTTGRSAAVYIVNYGGPIAMRLTIASRSFFDEPPDGLADHPMLEPRGVLMVGDESQRAQIESLAAEGRALDPSIELIDGEAARSMVPVLREEAAVVGMFEPGGSTMDVMGIHQAFVRGAVQNQATVHRHKGAIGIERRGSGWRVRTTDDVFDTETIVNAAGAWGDHVAELAGVAPVGLTPMRRTAFTVASDIDSAAWPLVHVDSADGPCYFKPEAGNQLLCSPSDEIASEACDARPEELDIARAIERINAATTLDIRAIKSSWAGLRTFSPDRQPVIGMDSELPGFCWMVGQGGTGITTSFASGQVVGAVVRGEALPPELTDLGLDAEDLGPNRLQRG